MKKKHQIGCILWSIGVVFFSAIGVIHANKSGVEPGVLSLPSGPGSLGGVGENVQANLNMGLMSYQIKVLVPKGRGSATPNPSITYSSSAGSGIVGIGWNFSAGSSIERATVRGLPTYTNEDLFYAGGELVKIPGGPFYRSRYEGSFMRYQWVQKDPSDQRGYWIVEAPDGSKMYYGANAKGEINLDAQVYGLKGTFRWELVTMVDRNGNRVEYSYFKEGAQTYPDQIAWVFDANNKPLYHLKFGYEDRPDFVSDGKPGFDLQITKRLKEVQITSNDQRFRSYHFDFEDNTGLSRLIKVTQYGRDASKAYPVQFSMKYSDAVFSPENSKMVTMPTALGVDFRTNNIDFIDINGDGLPDVVDTSKANHLFFINQLTLTADLKQDKHDFPRSLMIQNPTETSAPLSNPSVQMLDYNGDGFTDLVDAVNKKIYINKGNSKWEDSSTSLQNFPVTGTDPNMRFFDYNGDKAIDVISSDGSNTTYWVSDGKGNWKVTPGTTNIGLGFAKDKLKLIDINGDGLQDIVHITKNSMRYRKYLGYGKWTDWIDVKVPGIDQYELSTQAQFNDINGDGMADMVAFLGNSIVYFVNKNGVEFTAGQKLQTFKGVDLPDSTKTTVRIVDINGNGSRDIVYIDSSGKVVYLELFGKRPNLMTEISNQIGQRINVEYGSSVNFFLRDSSCDKAKDAACNGPWQNKMPMPFNVVTNITTWASQEQDPTSQTQPAAQEKPIVQKMYYHDGFYDGQEKKFRGFRQVESVRPGDDSIETSIRAIVYDVGDKDPYFHGRMLKTITSNDKQHIYNEQTQTWKECPLTGIPKSLDPPVRFICQESSETLLKEGEQDQAKWRTLRSEMEYDGYGNVTVMTNLGDKNKEGDEQIIKTTYIVPKDPNAPDSVWNIRLQQKIEYCNKTAPHCAERHFYYDGPAFEGLSAGQLTKGNPTRITTRIEAGKDQWINLARMEYDEYGNSIGVKMARGLLRTTEWDPVYHRFMTQETVHLGELKLNLTTSWDYSLSAPVKSTSFNGETLYFTHDDFGRLASVRRTQDAVDKPSIVYTYAMQAPISRVISQQRATAGGELTIKSVQCFDGLGRSIASANYVKDGTYLISGHREFNARGSEARKWQAYTSATDCQFAPPSAQKPQQIYYDAMGRKTRLVLEDGSISRKVYGPLRISTFDPEDNRKDSPHFDTPTIQLYDGLGRTIEMIETLAANKTISTKYEHTNIQMKGHQLLKRVTFANGSQKTHTYDLIGRILKLEDPDRSTISYAYDEESNVLQRVESNGNKILYTYDLANRPLSRQQDGKPETKITYAYDTAQTLLPDATHLKGRLAQVTFPIGSINYSYDINGNLQHSTHMINGHTFAFGAQFDQLNRPTEETFPDGRKLTYEYDAAGRLTKIPGQIDSVTYHADTTPATVQFANGIKTAYAFDVRRRVKSIDVGDGKVMKLDYTLDSASNITSIAHKYGSESFTNQYTTDALYRLNQAVLGNGNKETISYTFDDLHNTTSRISSIGEKSPIHLGKCTYDTKQIHALRKAGTRALGYDAHGNMTKDGEFTYQWDYLNRRVQVLRGGEIVGRTWYGPGASRLLKEENGVHTFYVRANYEIRDGRAVIYTRLGTNRVIAWSSPKGTSTVYTDLAPATGEATLTSKPDGTINAADAWLFHASRQKIVQLALPKQTQDIDYTKDYLQASLSQMLDGKTEQTHYFHPDHLGSVRAVTDEKGEVIARKDYYPHGFLRQSSGDSFSFGFQNTERDALTGANYFHTRFLDTHIGRWTSADPLFEQIKSTNDEFNSYGLTRANPINNRDFNGTESNKAMVADIVSFGLALVVGGYELFKSYKSYTEAKPDSDGKKKAAYSALLTASGMAAAVGAFAQQMSPGGYEGDLLQGIAGSILLVSVIIDGYSTYQSVQNNVKKSTEIERSFTGGLNKRDKKKLAYSLGGSLLLTLASGAGAAGGIGQLNAVGEQKKKWIAIVAVLGASAAIGGLAFKIAKGQMRKTDAAQPVLRHMQGGASYDNVFQRGASFSERSKRRMSRYKTQIYVK